MTKKDRILAVLEPTKSKATEPLTLEQVAKASGLDVPLVSAYLSSMVRAGDIVRPSRGLYRLRRSGEAKPDPVMQKRERHLAAVPAPAPLSTEDAVRADERQKLRELLTAAVHDAVPKEAEDYIRGFKDGAQFVLDQAFGPKTK